MTKRSISLEPQTVAGSTWYYETRGGLQVVHEVRRQGMFVQTDQVLIPWRMILASVRRYRPSKYGKSP